MSGTGHKRGRLSAILVMLALSVLGIACIPRLNIQYMPTSGGRDIIVSFSYPEASQEVVEADVTSLLEGTLSSLGGITQVSSVSRKGSGSITVRFQKGKDMDAARFEVASAIRNIYPSIPTGVSYPAVRLSSGRSSQRAISYILKSPLPSREIERYAREHLMSPLSALPDVDGAVLSGASPYHWVITFDATKARSSGISAQEIAESFMQCYSSDFLGMVRSPEGMLSVRLSGQARKDFGSIPIKKVGGQVIFLRDIASWRYEEALPSAYYRVNGLNTVTLDISTTESANLIRAVDAVKEEMGRLQVFMPEEITASVAYDASEYVRAELRKIYFRTLLCLLILLVFVFLVSRSWRYMFIVTSTLVVNILSALAIYALAGIQIHIYTLAGITVSLGIVIDTTIVMADHFRHWHNRRIISALFWATATTAGALLTTLLLPESERLNLTDFIWVIVINLTLSLLVAYFFVPSLMTYLPVSRSQGRQPVKRFRQKVKGRMLYRRYVAWGVKYRWLFVFALVLAFGIPRTFLSSSFGLFEKALDRSNFYRQPVRKQLIVRAGMLEGCTVHQLNEVIKSMENYLAGFNEIAVFTTSVSDYDNATIVVEFKPEYENSSFPSELKSQVTFMAANFGGANWRVYGIDDHSFNNNVVSDYKGSHIVLSGYNYQQLSNYARQLVDYLSRNARVREPEVWSGGSGGRPAMEYNMDYDFAALTVSGINPYRYYSELTSVLYNRPVGSVINEGASTEVVLRSSDLDVYDLWHVLHAPISVDSTQMTLASVGSIVKRRSGVDIRKVNQSYELDVCFDFIGGYNMQKSCMEDALDYMNNQILPIGFKAVNPDMAWGEAPRARYLWLILLIIGVVFVLLSMSLESIHFPLIILGMIPVSFIGVFLVFGLSDYAFDQGGFAAFVMLCGIVVNAGIYLVSMYQRLGGPEAPGCRQRIRLYEKAFGYKIVPIGLTILSTVLGLLPFLTDGPQEVFWFDFAIGTICGLAFSVVALVFVFPLFVVRPIWERRPR
ncbi:MAG: efflux RND transporter permease subunit [Bacteroidales bacterium]|nr:efflux RND transporter permease subunit [Bacteroidales bacterium]